MMRSAPPASEKSCGEFTPARNRTCDGLDWDIDKILNDARWPAFRAMQLDDYKPYGDPVATAIAKVLLWIMFGRAHYKMAENHLQRKITSAPGKCCGERVAPDPYPCRYLNL
jgi:hypothetical protein